MDNLNGIVAFVRTAETLSFVAAGHKLGISASAVGKSIARLERSLGVRLFHRTTRRVTLTEEGRHFHERCHRILEDLREAEAMLSEAAQTPRGRLRVSLPVIGYRFLLPVLPAFSARYPDIELDLDFNDRLVDVVEGGFDAVIRSGTLSDSSLMSRRLGPFRFVLCASPDYAARAGVPHSLDDLGAHDCVRYRFPTTGKLQPWALLPGGEEPPGLRTAMTCNNMEALRGAVIAGFGIGFMPDFLTRDALASGTLIEVLAAHTLAPGQFSVLWPSSRQLSPKLRVFVDFMCEHLFPESGAGVTRPNATRRAPSARPA
ncbi:LysR family transcriptional regulator [Burkholderia sp. Ac-20379]|uniref:LysR family transcriptional regulator n=1 Tax=Burkholderia sp. Ac-20379 TaxID=2703900 RepID=UPI00197FE2DD|nr:LysR family transcriptional regulator [Burkholderia sp. Ac-20379]MBN3724060.1 LysR family transcriptional regulator [Burkholderia sp. Ac-20379]